MTLLLAAFFFGVLTVLAPCVLPLLPIILGASVEEEDSKWTPYIIIASLSVSILVFSLLLKVSTVLIGVPPSFWKAFSWGLIIGLGIITIFPNLWKSLSMKCGFTGKSNNLLQKSTGKKGYMKHILMGFALGPVFSSCSPTYALILAIILPAGFAFGFLALIFYVLGLATVLLAIAKFGQTLIKKLKWVSNPNGIFKKILGFIFILVGLAIFTGFDKKIEIAILDAGFLNTTEFEQKIINDLELEKFEVKKNDKLEELNGQTCADGSCGKQVDWSLSFLNPKDILKQEDNKIVSAQGYQAPEFTGLTNWINTEGYSSMEELKGQVVLLEFWTLGCINCTRTHKHTNKLYETYKDQGFTVIGLHAPEFAYEKKIKNVQKAVTDFAMKYPVAQDNDFSTWKAYNNRYWPAFYLIDTKGKVRYMHFGEGKYEEKEQAIQELLAE